MDKRRAVRLISAAALLATTLFTLTVAVTSEVRCIFWQPDRISMGQTGEGVTLSSGRLHYWRYWYTGVISGMGAPGLVVIKNGDAEACGLPEAIPRHSLHVFRHEKGVWGEGWNIDLPLWPLSAAGLLASCLVVRALRRRPNTCPHCRYDTRGLRGEVCPECGKPLPPLS